MSINITAYKHHLALRERETATVDKYCHALTHFATFLGDRPLTKEEVIAWKAELCSTLSPSTVNNYLSALNGYLEFVQRPDCRVSFLRVQREVYREEGRDLTRAEYERIVSTARAAGHDRIALIMETICACGLRVSELRFVTVEAAQNKELRISLKGKNRTVFLPAKLRKKLLDWARQKGIKAGPIFVTRSGAPLTRQQIWRDMKAAARAAGVEESKVFPHNLRHLFAVEYYRRHRDIVKLADILGHSSVNTTRIYLISTGREHERQIEELGLVA